MHDLAILECTRIALIARLSLNEAHPSYLWKRRIKKVTFVCTVLRSIQEELVGFFL